MNRLRRALGIVAVIWLTGRMVTVALAPAELWLSGRDARGDDCECMHGADATCPMHHSSTTSREKCAMRGVAPVDGLALTSLLGASGCLTTTSSALFEPPSTPNNRTTVSTPVAQFARPDFPPPRA